MNINKEIIEGLEAHIAGKSLADIRKHLERNGFEKDMVSFIIKEIDEKKVDYDLKMQQIKKSKELIITGYVLMAIGMFLTAAAYFDFIDVQSRYFYIPAFGPVIGGYMLVVKSRLRLRQLQSDEE